MDEQSGETKNLRSSWLNNTFERVTYYVRILRNAMFGSSGIAATEHLLYVDYEAIEDDE